ncbi:MAG: hypothetical protein LV481_08785 [Methylacidiphilales bacterium]|nr:hypothetical protein [Candidatus Methylacidiphilales bacterium]
MTFTILRICLLWALVSLHFAGGAALFRRLAPRESPWFGYIIPFIVLCLICNFVEHFLPITTLMWLTPVTGLGSLWLILRPGFSWRGLLLPTVVFLGSFAFVLFVRSLRPTVVSDSDGVAECNLISNYLFGETLPPTESWMPPYKSTHYHTLMYYPASVMIRMFHLDIGTGYNMACAVLSTLICYLASAVAYQLSRGKVWLTLLMPLLIESTGTGCSFYVWMTTTGDYNPFLMGDVMYVFDNPNYHNVITHFLSPVGFWDRRDLQVPGFWSWAGGYQDDVAGQFLTLYAIWCLTELLRRKVSNWPWISLVLLPVYCLDISAWVLPIMGLIFIAGAVSVWWHKLLPRNPRFVLFSIGAALILLMPTLIDFLTISNGLASPAWTTPNIRTQLGEFILEWWPVTLMWLSLFFLWRRLPVSVWCLMIVLPLMFLLVEFVEVYFRPITTGKLWGDIYGGAYVAFLPIVVMRRWWPYRTIAALVIVTTLLSFPYWITHAWRTASWGQDIFHLEGEGPLHWDSRKAEMFHVLNQFHNQIIVTGRPHAEYDESPSLSVFTHNRNYIAWSDRMLIWTEPNGAEQIRRNLTINALYDGKLLDPLRFLRLRNITALVIWPDDHIPDNTLNQLKIQLAPAYEYCNYRDDGGENAGVFVYRPQLATLPPSADPIIHAAPDANGTPFSIGE